MFRDTVIEFFNLVSGAHKRSGLSFAFGFICSLLSIDDFWARDGPVVRGLMRRFGDVALSEDERKALLTATRPSLMRIIQVLLLQLAR